MLLYKRKWQYSNYIKNSRIENIWLCSNIYHRAENYRQIFFKDLILPNIFWTDWWKDSKFSDIFSENYFTRALSIFKFEKVVYLFIFSTQ